MLGVPLVAAALVAAFKANENNEDEKEIFKALHLAHKVGRPFTVADLMQHTGTRFTDGRRLNRRLEKMVRAGLVERSSEIGLDGVPGYALTQRGLILAERRLALDREVEVSDDN